VGTVRSSQHNKTGQESIDPRKKMPVLAAPISFRNEIERMPRILLIRLRSLGDSILTLPLIEALHRWQTDLQIDILVEAPHAPVFLRHPAIHETLIVKARTPSESAAWQRIQTIREIRKRHYPAAINLHGGSTALLLTLASGAKWRIGQEQYRGSFFYNVRIPRSTDIWQRSYLHTVEHQLSLMRWLGLPFDESLPGTLYLDEAARGSMKARLASEGINKYILIQPTATLATKQWSETNFAQLGDYLFRQYHLKIIFCCAAHEAQVLLDIEKAAKEKHTYWPDLSLDNLFALIESCRLFIGNDSGPTHAAAALHKPIVVVWGSSNFKVWHPWGTDYEAVMSDLPCIPCPGYKCLAFPEPRCILEIPFAKVAEACDRILQRT
jgi:heptosyltransferase-3